ncbi:MAG: thioredoxin domain-containing protein [Bacteroidia bacterium]
MKSTLTFAVILLALTLSSQNQGIKFEHESFEVLKAKAIKENKLIFIDAYTTWCGPCKYLAREIFTNDSVGNYYNSNFINAKMDMEKGEGLAFAKNYQVYCYPTLLFIDGKGNLVHRTAGAGDVSRILALGKQALRPEGTYSYHKANYEKDKNNSKYLMHYINAQASNCLHPDQEVKAYFNLQKEEDLVSADNWTMIKAHVKDMNSREFKFLLQNKNKFESLYSKEEVSDKIDNVHFYSLMNIIRQKNFDKEKYESTKVSIRKTNLGNTDRIILEADLVLAKSKKDWEAYCKSLETNTEKFYWNDAGQLNSIAWTVFENVSEKKHLEMAEKWAKRATEIEPGYANLDTYANLLFKNGKNSEALKAAGEAIELAKKDGDKPEDYKETTDLIEKIKSAKP